MSLLHKGLIQNFLTKYIHSLQYFSVYLK